VTPTSTGNLVEDNTILGNTNGIFLVAGAQGNTFRSNLVMGNPAVQVSLDNRSSSGYDIKNLADPGLNTFDSNVCLTSVNAPCPSMGTLLTAIPNPIPVAGNATYGMTSISWSAGSDAVEVHIGSPDGILFASGGRRGSANTGVWVPDGMTFYLQDVSGGKPLTSENTLASLVVHLQKSTQASIWKRRTLWAGASAIPLLGVVFCGVFWRRRD
jgi:parallel beta-helix repeat protein